MYQRLITLILHWLRVPPEPHPPHGDPASLRVFRAGKNYFNLRLAGWGLGQLAALAGIIFWLVVFIDVEHQVQAVRQSQASPPPELTAKNFAQSLQDAVGEQARPAANQDDATAPKTATRKNRNRNKGLAEFKQMLVQAALWLPPWAFPIIWLIKFSGIGLYLAQIPVTYAIRRLDYELRWYMVTDRSLRIRHGVWKVSESTMSFANIQQVVVSQDPIQRLLGLSDVKVQSAGGGGGGGDKHDHPGRDDMHLGLFHGVTNAAEIRDLILERLRRFRESGLGDPEEATTPAALPAAGPSELLAAARELATEARALRTPL